MILKRPGYSVLLKILASAAVGSFLYAAAVTIRTVVFSKDGGLPAAVIFLLTLLMGHFAGGIFLGKTPAFAIKASVFKPVKFLSFMLELKDTAYSVSAAVAWALISVPLLLTGIIYSQAGSFRMIFELFAAALAYSAALKQSQLSFPRIMSNVAAYTGFAVLALALETMNLLKSVAYLKPWVLAISYFFILAYFILKNQEEIDKNIFDKKHIEKSILPRNLRRFNTFWVSIIFVVLLLVFNLQPIVVKLLKLFITLSLYFAAAIGWILDHIFHFGSVPRQSGAVNPNDFFGSTAETIHPLKNLISNILKYSVMMYLAYRLLLLMGKGIPGLIKKISKLLEKLFHIKQGKNSFETTDYSDVTETVKPMRESEQRRQLKKKIRRSSRAIKSITDPVEKVRAMYASILNILPECGIRPEQSDTTAEILKKASVSSDISSELSPFTGIYNQVRYGEQIPDAGILTAAEGHYNKAVVFSKPK